MKLLEKLINTFSVSANENKIKEVIKESLEGASCEISEDNIGNLIAKKSGNGIKIGVFAPQDLAGGIVTYKDKEKIRFVSVGDINEAKFINMTAVFENGKKGFIYCEDINNLSFDNMYIDACGLDETQVGDVFLLKGEIFSDDEKIIAVGAGDKACLYALIEALKEENKNDITAVFASRSHVGFKGAAAAAENMDSDICICLGESENDFGSILLTVKGKNMLSDEKAASLIEKLLKEENILFKREVNLNTSSPAGLIKKASGSRCVSVNLPVKYKKSPYTAVSKKDINELVKALKKLFKAQVNL